MRKALSCVILSLLLLLFLPFTAQAAGQPLISDDAELLTAEEEKALLSVMEPITAFGNIAFKTVSENSTSADSFAKSFYQSSFGLTDGAVFLIDMDNRKIYIYCQDAFYQTISSSRSETITDNVYKYASRGEYYECAAEAFREIYTLLEGGRIAQPMKYTSNAFLALILALMINFVIVRMVTRLRGPRQKEIVENANAYFEGGEGSAVFTRTTKRYDPIRTSGGGSGGGGHSGGGGGGHSGGGGGHSF